MILMKAYRAMLTKCRASRPEYPLLKNSIIARRRYGKEQVEIICGSEQAKQIIDFAATDCAELSPSVNLISPAPRAV